MEPGAHDLLWAAVRLGSPLLLAALGEVLVERSGRVNVGIEGMMLGGALGAVLVGLAGRGPGPGLAAALLAGTLLAALFAALVLGGGADEVVAGAGINLLAAGSTTLLYQIEFGRTGGAIAAPRIAPLLGVVPPSAVVGLVLAALIALFLRHTIPGLLLRAAGEAPHAVRAAGASVVRLQLAALLCGGGLAGLAGAFLALEHAGTFVPGMTAGRGFLALAVVLVARARPLAAVPCALAFGLSAAAAYALQAQDSALPYPFARMLPYLASLVVLAALPRRIR